MKGLLVVISSPSGGGKTTVINELIRQLPRAARFVTSTTRSPRPTETNGVDYIFLTHSEFVYKIVQDDFAEYVQYAGNFYGTDKKLLEQMLSKYDFVFAPIDVRGAASLRALPFRQISIFLAPESREVLEKRLRNRPGMTPEELERRLALGDTEMPLASEFDHTLVNREGQFTETVTQVKAILDKNA